MIQVKRGDTFSLVASVTEDGAPKDITGWIIRCQARTSDGTAVETFTITITDAANGLFRIDTALPTSTQGWPVGTIYSDIEYNTGSETISTQTFTIAVLEDQTI